MQMFLKAVGEAVVAKGLGALKGFVPFGNVLFDVGADAIDRYRLARREARIAEDVEEVLKAELKEIRAEAEQIVREMAAGEPEEIIDLAVAYLTQMPGAIRQSLKRADDPSGTTVPPSLNLQDPLQLGALLPRRLPTFRAGDAVPHAPQWRFVEMLGAGGFGEVWLAKHAYLDDLRAIKFCLDPASRNRLLTHEKDVVRRVMQASAADADHGIVRLLDCYLEPDGPWLAYEYIDGGDLTAWARANALLAPPVRAVNALAILRDLAGVVGHLHAQNPPVTHRDLKPANVLLKKVNGKWLLRVTDFGIGHVGAAAGIARATVSTPSMSLGDTYRGAHTPNYASPQQKRGEPADPRDDVHALGIIALQLLLGDLSAERPSGNSWKKKLKDSELPGDLLDALARCWEDDPDERPTNARELVASLAPLSRSGGERVSARSKPPHSKPEHIIPLVSAAPPRPTLIVSADGTGQHREIADAVADAKPGTLIRVNPGVYRKPVVLNMTVEITGDGPRERIVLEAVDSNCIEVKTETATVRGLTLRLKDGGTKTKRCAVYVTKGKPLFENCAIASELLSCLEITGKQTAPTVRNCIMSDSREGSGVFVYGGAGGVIEDCQMTGNKLAGVSIKNQGTTPTLRKCVVKENQQSGVFVNDGAGGTVEDCQITGNRLAGVSIKNQDTAPTFRRCVMSDSREGSGAYVYEGAGGVIEDCQMTGNKLAGVEIKGQGTAPKLRKCQIHKNGYAAIRVHQSASGTVENCDLRDNPRGPWNIDKGCTVTKRNNTE